MESMTAKKVLIVSTIASLIKQFCFDDIKILIEMASIDIICNFEKGNTISQADIESFKEELRRLGIGIFEAPFSRSPLRLGNIKALFILKKVLGKDKYDLVHCHTPIASAITRLAVRTNRSRYTKIIYTAHGFHFHKGGSILGWLIYYPVEKLLARFTDLLIAINTEDFNLAKKNLHAKKIAYVPGIGIRLHSEESLENGGAKKREQMGIPSTAYVILSVGELNFNKNHESVIRAISTLEERKGFLYIICGQGSLRARLEALTVELGLVDVIRFLGYRNDVAEIMNMSDILIHASLREGLSVAIMEAMAWGLPVICSRIRGNTDLVIEGKGGSLVNPRHYGEIAKAITQGMNDRFSAADFGDFNREHIRKFERSVVESKMREIYSAILQD